MENGRREPKLSLIEALASALSVSADELMRKQPPSRRAQLEIELAEAQRDPVVADLGLPPLRVGAKVPNDVLEHMVALHAELRRQRAKPTATPEEARAANADLRLMMSERGNYFAEIEEAAAKALAPAGYTGGALSQGMLLSVIGYHGFGVRYVDDLPRSARSVTDLRNRRIYLKQEPLGMHTPRAASCSGAAAWAFRALATRCARRLRRVPALSSRREARRFRRRGPPVPEARLLARFLREAKEARDLSVEDLRDVFSVSYEMAAHRFTNLATHHLGIPCHFV